jgi:hypothetical protein
VNNHFVDALAHSVSIYVPSTVNVNTPVDSAKVVNETLSKLSAIFGGCTASNAQGAWISDSEGLVTEKVTICKSFTGTLDDTQLDKVYDIALAIKRDMAQEAVSVEVDNSLYFV